MEAINIGSLADSAYQAAFGCGSQTGSRYGSVKKETIAGYTLGILKFIKSKKQDIMPMRTYELLKMAQDIFRVIATEEGLEKFLRGLNLKGPDISRGRIPSLLVKEAYRLGFVIGIAREKDVIIRRYLTPIDDISYKTFMLGLNRKEMPEFGGAYGWLDTLMYNTGLRLHPGFNAINKSIIDSSELVRAFTIHPDGQSAPMDGQFKPSPPVNTHMFNIIYIQT